MKIYSYYGFNEFIIIPGYKGYMIKEYFANYYLHIPDVTTDIKKNMNETHENSSKLRKISLTDTGDSTMTGGRVKCIQIYIENERFMLTYGDGVSNMDIKKVIRFHEKSGTIGTLTAAQPARRFGVLEIDKDRVTTFLEKPPGNGGYIKGGFSVFELKVFDSSSCSTARGSLLVWVSHYSPGRCTAYA